jgi:hypothetical protein
MTQTPGSKRSSRWYRLLLYGLTVVLLVPASAGVRLVQGGSIALGVGVVGVGLVTVALWIRFVRREPGPSSDGSLDITSERVDLAIWMAIGVPFLFVGLMVVWLLANGLPQR